MDRFTTLAIKNGHVLLPQGEFTACDVGISGGRIQSLTQDLEAEQQIGATGAYVLPGLIDLHTHGIHTESAEAGSLQEYARLEASHGATTFYPTLFAPPEQSAQQMIRHRQETDELQRLPQIGGFRLESPYLARTGAGVSRDLVPISAEVTELLLQAGGGHIRIWDISPELTDAPDLIRQLVRIGIVCSIAHTQATIGQARTAVDAGARLVTHLFDTFAVPQMTDPGVYPASLVDYLLLEDRLTCEIIGDGTHVHPLLVEKTLRCKPPGRVVLVTDSNFGAGLPPGRYTLPGSWGNVVIQGPNGGVRQVDRGMGLAGSALTPIDEFRNVIHLFQKDIATASRLLSWNPAHLMGLNKGEIAAGKDADLVILDEHLDLLYTIVAGTITYEAC